MTPPPMMTTRAWEGKSFAMEGCPEREKGQNN